MTVRLRSDQISALIENEALFGDGWQGIGNTVVGIKNLSRTPFRNELIANDLYSLNGGSHGNIAGLSLVRNGGVTFDTFLEGLSTAATAAAAVATAVTDLVAACFQATPVLTTGSTVKAASVPTTTSMVETDAGAHDLGSATAIGIIGVVVAGVTYWRPYTYTVATDTIDLLIALPAAPTEGAVLYGTANLAFTQKPAAERSVAIRFLGNDAVQNVELKGGVGKVSIPDTAPAEVPLLNFDFAGTDHASAVADTREAPSNALASVMAGGEYLVAKFGSTVKKSLEVAKVSVSSWGMPALTPSGNNASGIGGNTPDHAPLEMTALIPISEVPPAACTSATWEAMSYNNLDADDDLQVMYNFSRLGAGRSASWYMQKAKLTGWERVDQDNIEYQKLTFTACDGITFIGHFSQG